MSKATIRLFPPAAPSATDPILISGRRYASAGALFVDFYAPDAFVAIDAGWTLAGLVGNTVDRPLPLDWDSAALLSNGTKFLDLSLGKVVQYDARSVLWRDCVTGVPV
jgi:hypothetical protein